MALNIVTGKMLRPQKVVIYGPEGIGKSTLASKFPDPLFIDTEGSTYELDVKRVNKPETWEQLISYVSQIAYDPAVCKTLVIDTADWAEALCINYICNTYQMDGIESFGYGKGYVYLAEEFKVLLDKLSGLIDRGLNVVLTAHATIKKFERPDEMGAYDRWELKLQRKTAPLVKEWADMVLFANYETYVYKTDNNTVKAQGGKRVIYTSHHPCWDAKNRKGLPDKIDMDYSQIAAVIPEGNVPQSPQSAAAPETPPEAPKEEEKAEVPEKDPHQEALKALDELLNKHDVTRKDVEDIVADKGYYSSGTRVESYATEFIQDVLIGAWDDVYNAIINKAIPF